MASGAPEVNPAFSVQSFSIRDTASASRMPQIFAPLALDQSSAHPNWVRGNADELIVWRRAPAAKFSQDPRLDKPPYTHIGSRYGHGDARSQPRVQRSEFLYPRRRPRLADAPNLRSLRATPAHPFWVRGRETGEMIADEAFHGQEEAPDKQLPAG
jgi:hypothetical protein